MKFIDVTAVAYDVLRDVSRAIRARFGFAGKSKRSVRNHFENLDGQKMDENSSFPYYIWIDLQTIY